MSSSALDRALFAKGSDMSWFRRDEVARAAILDVQRGLEQRGAEIAGLQKGLADHTTECTARWNDLYKATQKIQWWVIATLITVLGVLVLGLARQHGWLE